LIVNGDKRRNPQSNVRTLKTVLGQVMLHQFTRYLNKELNCEKWEIGRTEKKKVTVGV